MLSVLASVVLSQGNLFPVRWFYVQTNLAVVANVDKLVGIMERAKTAGYNGMVITDSKFSILDQMGSNYFDNAERVRLKASELGLSVTPVVASVGWAGGLLAHDVNLIEGQPVKKAPFVVKGGILQAEKSVTYANAGFEEVNGDKLVRFSYQDEPGKSSFSDTAIKHGGNRSIRFENYRNVNARVMHAVSVRPWNQYRVRFWLKTEGVDRASDIRCFAMGEGGKVLSFMDVGAKVTQDWTEHTIVFNSQSFDKLTLYAGLWSGNIGKFWLDDFSVEEAGFLNVVRTPGNPIKLETEAGKVLEEGKDYERVEDLKLGTSPWMGEYTFTQPSPMTKTTLPDGTRVLATFTHAVSTEQGKTAICPSAPKTQILLQDEMKRVADLWKPKGLFLAHDEIRVANQCPTCTARGLTPGQIYAEDLRRCTAMSKKTIPGGTTIVWSDMFDPYHNAVDNYYLANGTWKESWKGVTPELTIMNWNSGNAAKSLAFFEGLGCHQILSGFYDGPVSGIVAWLDEAKSVKNVDGVMYTTWVNDYSKLEEFAKVAFRRR